MINTKTYTNKNFVDRRGGSNAIFNSTVTRSTLCEEPLELEEVRTEYNSKWRYVKLSNFISLLESLKEKYGDGYIMAGSNEMTSELFSISVIDEHIQFEGLPDGNPEENYRFFSLN